MRDFLISFGAFIIGIILCFFALNDPHDETHEAVARELYAEERIILNRLCPDFRKWQKMDPSIHAPYINKHCTEEGF